MRSTGRFHLALLASAAVVVALGPRAAVAQEVLDDQDPIDLDWIPAWDTPFWPAPTGAALEVAVGRTGVPAAPGAGGMQRVKSGDYVLALLTLPLGARGRARVMDADAGAEEVTVGEEIEAPSRRAHGDRLAQGAGGAGTSTAPPAVETDSGRASVPSAAPTRAPAAGQPAGATSSTGSGGALSGPMSPEQRVGAPEREPGRPRPRQVEVPFELLRAALDQAERAAGLDASLRRLAALGQRSRWSGLSPELRLRGATGIDQTRSTDSAGIVPAEETLRDASDSLVEVRLTFHLERLLYSGQEVQLERARQQLLADRAELRVALGRELLNYRRAVSRLQDEELLDEDRADLEFDAERARLALFLLTDGWFRGEETVRRYESRPR